ncbi:MAG: hypothetical protein A2287_04260 [Candidatus Melainabacteria bacterium RIFOXYA12_FULL_32_12]|nr:MAG: hypothetical protein A2255_08195 [Candidatus Melainabacteria bacterium RIFOXYA2_FULL_32_9]OGI30617.1 MAG: hypothetical protein A2287_04260 [Candidatus Melainabacteria bacterium RIFOXYA12_FULL_32_12]
MEFDQLKGGVGDHFVESKEKIEHLNKMVKGLTDNKNPGGNDTLKRIEAKLDIIAQQDNPNEYLDVILENLRTGLEEKQSILDSKITSIEELAGQITGLLKDQSLDQTTQKEFDSFRVEIGNLTEELTQIQENINDINGQIVEVNKNSQQTNNIICNISDKQALEYIKSATDSLDLNINATLSALSILDLKVKTISDNLEKISSLDNINLIKDDVARISDKINGLLEIIRTSSTVKDIDNIKGEINLVFAKFGEFQDYIDPSIADIKEGLDELLDQKANESIKNELVNINKKVFELVETSQPLNNIDLIKNNVIEVSEKLSEVREVLSKTPTNVDIGYIKKDIETANNRFGEFQEHMIFTIAQLKENLNEALNREIKGELSRTTDDISDKFEQIKNDINTVDERFSELQNYINPSMADVKESLSDLIVQTSNESIKNELTTINEKISELAENSQQINNIDLVKDKINTVDARISWLQNYIDPSITGIKESLNELILKASDEPIKSSVIEVSEKLGEIQKILGKTSTTGDIEHIKTEINFVNAKFSELQNHIDSSIVNIKDNFGQLLTQETGEKIENELGETVNKLSDGFESVKNNISSVQQEILNLSNALSFITEKIPELENTTNSLNVKDDVEEIKNLVNDLFLKDDTRPLIDNLELIQSKINELEYLTKNNFEPKLTKVQDDFYIFQDKLNISISSLIKPINEELIDLNEKILDLKEYFAFRKNNDDEHKDELAIIAERFNDIWTSARLTLDKLNDQVLVTEDSIDKFQNTVKRFFDLSEDTNIVITNILKKTTDIDSSLSEIDNRLEEKLDNIAFSLNNESRKILNNINEGNNELTDKLSSMIEADFNFLRSDIIEFKDKQERVLQDNLTNQESVQNSLSNLHFSITDSADSVVKKLNDVALDVYKLNNSSLETLSNTEVVKEALVQIAGWVDNAEALFTETNDNVREIKENDEVNKILAELIAIKEYITKNSVNHEDVSTRIENNLAETKDDIKSSLNVIKKRQEYDFDNINTNISGVSQELFNITQSITSFEDKIKQDIQVLSNSISEKLNSSQTAAYPIEEIESNLESNLNQIKENINVELKKISNKFSDLETNFENVEEKLNNIETRLAINNDQEMKQMLEFIAGQVTMANESGKGTGLLLKKIAVLEKQMGEFDTSLRKVVSFLDAE